MILDKNKKYSFADLNSFTIDLLFKKNGIFLNPIYAKLDVYGIQNIQEQWYWILFEEDAKQMEIIPLSENEVSQELIKEKQTEYEKAKLEVNSYLEKVKKFTNDERLLISGFWYVLTDDINSSISYSLLYFPSEEEKSYGWIRGVFRESKPITFFRGREIYIFRLATLEDITNFYTKECKSRGLEDVSKIKFKHLVFDKVFEAGSFTNEDDAFVFDLDKNSFYNTGVLMSKDGKWIENIK